MFFILCPNIVELEDFPWPFESRKVLILRFRPQFSHLCDDISSPVSEYPAHRRPGC